MGFFDKEFTLPSTTRKVNLHEWTSADIKPQRGQKVWVCDADYLGFADYEFHAFYDGEDFILEKLGRLTGVTYWKPREN